MRTRAFAASLASLLIAASFATMPSAVATPPTPPGPAITLPFLTRTSALVPGAETGGPGTAALNVAVVSACNSGHPLAAQQWFTLPTGNLGTVIARAIAHKSDLSHNSGALASTSLAIVDYTTNTVLGCGGQATVTSSDNAAVVMWWDATELQNCRTGVDDSCDFDPHAVELFVTASSGLPGNDDPATATTIGALPYTNTVDGTLSPPSGNPVGLNTCLNPPITPDDSGRVFWTYTATGTGDLPISAVTPDYWIAPSYPWVGVADITGGSPGSDVSGVDGDCGFGRTFPVTNGHTYLIQVSHMNDTFFNLDPAPGGPVTVHVGPIGSLGGPPLTAADNGSLGVVLNWSAPTSSGGTAPVSSYQVTRDGTDSLANGPQSISVPTSTTTHTFANLIPGDTYTFTVTAVNAVGFGVPSTAKITVGVPGPPTNVTASVNPSAHSATLNWEPPTATSGQSVTGYRVSRTGNDTANVGPWSAIVPASASAQIFTNLLPGSDYILSVQAITAGGTSSAATASADLPGTDTPRPPDGVTATRGNRTATVQWNTPAQTGTSAITGYRVRRFSGSSNTLIYTAHVSATTHSFTATNLTNGNPSSFDVTAINGSGTGAPSIRSNVVTPATVPNAPPIGTAAAGTPGGPITALARWSASTSNGGSTITGYRVTALRMSASNTVLGTTVSSVLGSALRSFTMTLPVTGNYRFTVQAINAVGGSAESARSNLVAGR